MEQESKSKFAQRIVGIKDALAFITPQGFAERKLRRAVENTAAALSLDVIMKTRHFHQEDGVPIPISQQLGLARHQEAALMTLARNGSIELEGVRKIYSEMNWPLTTKVF